MERAQGVVDVMAKMAAAERKRRVAYRSDVGGVVPFEVKGLRDVSVEGVDVRVNSGAGDDTEDGAEEYTIDRPDVDAFMALLAGIERDPDPWVVKSASETRVALQKLIVKMDGMEDGFDRIAERSCSWSNFFVYIFADLVYSAFSLPNITFTAPMSVFFYLHTNC